MRYLAVTSAVFSVAVSTAFAEDSFPINVYPSPGAESAGDGTGGFAEGDLRAIVGAQTTAVIAS